MNLFDLMEGMGTQPLIDESENLPNVSEFSEDEILSFEKEVLGIYVSGHPLDSFRELWNKQITAPTSAFKFDEEMQSFGVDSGYPIVIGGIISDITIKFTKDNKRMGFVQLEDLLGTVEVVVFPRNFEQNEKYLQEDRKVFIVGHADVSGETQAKLICDKVVPFEDAPKQVWLQFKNKEEYLNNEKKMTEILTEFSGKSKVVIYLSTERARKILPSQYNITLNEQFLTKMYDFLGKDNVKVVDIPIEKYSKMH